MLQFKAAYIIRRHLICFTFLPQAASYQLSPAPSQQAQQPLPPQTPQYSAPSDPRRYNSVPQPQSYSNYAGSNNSSQYSNPPAPYSGSYGGSSPVCFRKFKYSQISLRAVAQRPQAARCSAEQTSHKENGRSCCEYHHSHILV